MEKLIQKHKRKWKTENKVKKKKVIIQLKNERKK